jgi:hypothetical protein
MNLKDVRPMGSTETSVALADSANSGDGYVIGGGSGD